MGMLEIKPECMVGADGFCFSSCVGEDVGIRELRLARVGGWDDNHINKDTYG